MASMTLMLAHVILHLNPNRKGQIIGDCPQLTKRRGRCFTLLTVWMALAVIPLCGMGCRPAAVRQTPVEYQEIALIQLESGFVPNEVFLVKGQPARLHITNAFEKTTTFTVLVLGINAECRHAELTQITLADEQLGALDGKKFTCLETGNTGTFHVLAHGKETRTMETSGAVELAVVMTDDLAAPHSIVVKKGVPLKFYVTKTKGEETDDTLLIEAWGIRKDIEAGRVTEITFTPTTSGEVTFMGIVTPSSRGIIHVIE